MVLAGAGQVVVETAAVVFLAGTVAAATAAWLAVRAARRRLRRWRLARTAVPWMTRSAAGAVAAITSSPAADRHWWMTQHERHRMWRAVSGAERAVRAARSAEAPTGDLRSLVRQLRTTARAVDAGLRTGSTAGPARAQAAKVVAAAREIHQAAADALLSVARPETTGLAAAVEVEVTALRHGLAAAAHR
ncbi:MAG TPA: hypothetical protein VFJ17_11715 [Mycobacteriales bacterium]|jgi:hypothetical protein|nr:hypothetical protein [Mycobacteriales bacterium]